jgi:cob(I)alamin adenosyltransferase
LPKAQKNVGLKIYTKKGDRGKTSLFGGKDLFKDDLRIEAYGSVDEFNAQVGVVIALMTHEIHQKRLLEVQKNLFTIGAILATDPRKIHLVKPFREDSIQEVESWIDEMDASLPILKNFILPSGSPVVAQCHVARTVCRRAERRIVGLYKDMDEPLDFLIYINRLSDFFFVLARKMCEEEGCTENLWLGD